jgi:hypothetical protein
MSTTNHETKQIQQNPLKENEVNQSDNVVELQREF